MLTALTGCHRGVDLSDGQEEVTEQPARWCEAAVGTVDL